MSGKPTDINVVVLGFKDCPYYQKALEVAQKIADKDSTFTFEKHQLTRDEFHVERVKILGKLGKSEDAHKSCPMVYSHVKNVPKDLIGGCDSLKDFARVYYEIEP